MLIEAAVIKEGLARTDVKKSKVSLDVALSACGLAEEDVVAAAHMLAEAVAPVIVYGKGISAFGGEAVMDAMVRVAKLTGAS